MMQQKKLYFILFFILIFKISCIDAQTIKERYPFSKIVIWGHTKLYTHTHAWIHWAFYRTFMHLGYETLWLDNQDNVDSIDFSNALFITEGQVDQNIPIRHDAYYILHNCNSAKYARAQYVTLQVFTYDVLARDVQEVQDFIFIDSKNKTIYMPWATDLLPHEIDAIKATLPHNKKNNIVNWVGTINGGGFGNIQEIEPFKNACKANGISFNQRIDVTMEQNIQYTQESYMAPAIVGTWQKKQGYIPCRIFKNISYGKMGITNSKAVNDLFKGKIVYNENSYQLFYDAKNKLEHMEQAELFDLMDFVRDNHTYINRIEHLLNFINKTAMCT